MGLEMTFGQTFWFRVVTLLLFKDRHFEPFSDNPNVSESHHQGTLVSSATLRRKKSHS